MQTTTADNQPAPGASPSPPAISGHCLCRAITITVSGQHDPRVGACPWFNDVEQGGQPKSYELMPGLFDAARQWPLRSEICVDRAMGCVSLAGEHRRKSRAEYEAGSRYVEGDLD